MSPVPPHVRPSGAAFARREERAGPAGRRRPARWTAGALIAAALATSGAHAQAPAAPAAAEDAGAQAPPPPAPAPGDVTALPPGPPAPVAPDDVGTSPAPPLPPLPPVPSALEAPAQAPEAIDAPVDVTVRAKSRVETLRESARAVDVIDLSRDRRYTADLGSVLARSEGIGVRRTGALGSDARISLNGLSDEQVRVFFDGVPLELAGYPFGVNNVPVELVRRVDVHRGVVPLRLGTDALGGAIELIGDEGTRGTHAGLSYQVGSFDTHRLLGSARHYDRRTGAFVRSEGFFDSTRNDYPIRVRQQGPRGYAPITVRRNNDDYRAAFGSVEAGFVHRPWARKLLLRAFLADADKGVPSDPLMGTPYGKITASRRAAGTLLRYESVPILGAEVSLIAGYNARWIGLRDLASCSYDWVGQCTVDRAPSRGERSLGEDTHVLQQSGLARLRVERALAQDVTLRLGVAPTYTQRRGENRALPTGTRDELEGRRSLLTLVSGVEVQADLLDDRLQTLLFAKHYVMRAHSQALTPGGTLHDIDTDAQRAGAGAALRQRLGDSVWAKASYEYATRLPAPDQLFGDASQLIDANLSLKPERAHNANLSAALDLRGTASGDFRGQLALFARRVDDLVYMFTRPTARIFENVERARALGLEGNLGWTSPGRWIALDANATFQDYRNRADRGEFADFRGGRMPNQPYLFANGVAQVFARKLMPERDELSLTYRTSYVHDFVVGWENANPGGLKLRVPSQLVHGLALALVLERDRTTITSTLEVHNLSDARVYDYLGVQLPGRMVAAKFTIGI